MREPGRVPTRTRPCWRLDAGPPAPRTVSGHLPCTSARGMSQGFSGVSAGCRCPRAVRTSGRREGEPRAPGLSDCVASAIALLHRREQPGAGSFLVSWFMFLIQTQTRQRKPRKHVPAGPQTGRRSRLGGHHPPGTCGASRGPRLLRGPPQMRLGSGAPPPSAPNLDAFR